MWTPEKAGPGKLNGPRKLDQKLGPLRYILYRAGAGAELLWTYSPGKNIQDKKIPRHGRNDGGRE